jgi:hypothetical protein
MTAQEVYKRANNKVNTQDYQGALADYTEALTLNPNLC